MLTDKVCLSPPSKNLKDRITLASSLPMKKLTIAIPTFNRPKSVCEMVGALLESEGSDQFGILVADDCSSTDIHGRLSEAYGDNPKFKNVSTIRNKKNLGYAGNFLNIFKHVSTPYVMIAADDDVILNRGVVKAIEIIEQEQAAFYCTQWLQNNKMYRGIADTREIHLEEFFCALHAPGLIYNVEICNTVTNEIQSRLASGCDYSHTYPQVVLLLLLLLKREKCLFVDVATAKEGLALPSGVRDTNSEPYWVYRSRLRQAACLDKIIEEYSDPENYEHLRDHARVFLQRAILQTLDPTAKSKYLKKVWGRELERIIFGKLKKNFKDAFKRRKE